MIGADGCVSYQFKHCGQILFAPGINEDLLMETAIDAGADDVIANDDGSFEVITPPNNFIEIKAILEEKGFVSEYAEVVMKALNETELNADESVKMQRLLDAFEMLDDVQDVYSTAILDM